MSTPAVTDADVEILAGNYISATITFVPNSGTVSLAEVTAVILDGDHNVVGTYTQSSTPAITTTGTNAFKLQAQIPRNSKAGKVATDNPYRIEWAAGTTLIYQAVTFDIAPSGVPGV